MSKSLAVSTKELTKAFNGKEVVHDCNTSVEQGSIYGFLGKNGAGKTAFFKMLLVFSYTVISMLLCGVAVLTIFFTTEIMFPLCAEAYEGSRENVDSMELIFIHGLGQVSSSWNETTSHLSDHIRANCLDLYALCEDKEITYGNLYRAFEKYCGDTAAPLNICGISLGAVLALNYAIDHKEKVKSLVLIAPQYKTPRLLLRLQNVIIRIIPERFFRKQGLLKRDIIRITNSMMGLDFKNRLRDISCATVVICGSRDKANIKAANYVACNIPNAELYLIENVGHEVNTDAPHRLATILNAFFGGK
jgi:pimeloyl-ACP methyl ester carboxylesterase